MGKENWVDTQKWNNRKINKGYETEKDVEYWALNVVYWAKASGYNGDVK